MKNKKNKYKKENQKKTKCKILIALYRVNQVRVPTLKGFCWQNKNNLKYI